MGGVFGTEAFAFDVEFGLMVLLSDEGGKKIGNPGVVVLQKVRSIGGDRGGFGLSGKWLEEEEEERLYGLEEELLVLSKGDKANETILELIFAEDSKKFIYLTIPSFSILRFILLSKSSSMFVEFEQGSIAITTFLSLPL